jgi:hypothetical protein
MKICFTVWLLAIAVSCSVNNSAKTVHIQNGNTAVPGINSNSAPAKDTTVKNANLKTTVVKNMDSKTLDCDDPIAYKLVVVTDPERASQNPVTVPEILNIVAGDETKVAIKIPTDSDAQNFSLDSTAKTKEGFEITIEYGTRYYYQKRFDLICKEGNFYLDKVKVTSFDKFDPASRANWDTKEIKIRPNLPVEKFSIFDYLVD